MQLIEYGTKIIDRRKEFVNQVNKIISDIHLRLTGGKEHLSLSYETSAGDMPLEQAVRRYRERDLKLKSTSVGPHRDDMGFQEGSLDIRRFGSQGQQRTAALSTEMSEIELVRSVTGRYPRAFAGRCFV